MSPIRYLYSTDWTSSSPLNPLWVTLPVWPIANAGYRIVGWEETTELGVSETSDRLWTPRHRIFQQTADLRWEPVFERIVEALKVKVHGLE